MKKDKGRGHMSIGEERWNWTMTRVTELSMNQNLNGDMELEIISETRETES